MKIKRGWIQRFSQWICGISVRRSGNGHCYYDGYCLWCNKEESK